MGELLRDESGAEDDAQEHLIEISKVSPDPDNPRRLMLTDEEFEHLQDPDWVSGKREDDGGDKRVAVLLGLRELADSMPASGVLQAIRVYRYGSGYRIAFGERRYWGARLANLTEIPARVHFQRPTNLRTLQLVENLQREDLDLSGRMRSVLAMMEEIECEGDVSGQLLAKLVGMSDRQARRYLQVAKGPREVLDAVVEDRGIRDLLVAATVAGIEDAEKRAVVLRALAAGKTLKNAQAEAERAVNASAGKARGRPATKVTLGTTANVVVVRTVMERVLGDEGIPNLDWNDYGAVSKAWKDFLRKLEESL
ncbi:hypothetical protein CKO23_19690 [Thiocystis violacea]|nr:hypothetical protein [Thiocystis violacea]